MNVSRAAQISCNISQYITGIWFQHVDGLVQELRQSIAHISSTRWIVAVNTIWLFPLFVYCLSLVHQDVPMSVSVCLWFLFLVV